MWWHWPGFPVACSAEDTAVFVAEDLNNSWRCADFPQLSSLRTASQTPADCPAEDSSRFHCGRNQQPAEHCRSLVDFATKVFFPQVFTFADDSCLSSSLLLNLLPTPEPRICTGSSALVSAGTCASINLDGWPLLLCTCTLLASFLITIIHSCVCAQGEPLQQHECACMAKASTAACGPGSGPDFCHWPALLGSPATSPWNCAPAPCQPNSCYQPPLTCTHPWWDPAAAGVRADSQGPCQLLVCLQLALAPAAVPNPHPCVCVFTIPCHYASTCSWSHSWACVTPGFVQDSYLPWSSAAGRRSAIEDPNSHSGPLMALAKDHAVVNIVDSSGLSWRDITPSDLKPAKASILGTLYH